MGHPKAKFCEAFRPPKPPRAAVAIMAQRYVPLTLHTLISFSEFAIAGNIQQFSGRHSNEWNKHVAQTYGPLSRLTGPFSVSNEQLTTYRPLARLAHSTICIARMAQRLRSKGVVQHSD